MSKEMIAGVLYGVRDLRVEKVPVPEMDSDEVLVKIEANGICGSDIHFFEKGKLGPFIVDKPYIPGHESSGVVVNTGKGVDSLKKGDRVVIEPGIPCQRCQLCKKGKYNLCENVTFLSAPPVNGTFCEYVSIPYDFVYKIPDNMSFGAGAMVEPTVVGVHACNRAKVTAGMSVTILGTGPIGLLTLQVARAFGATEIIAVDIVSSRLKLSEDLGANWTINANNSDPLQKINEITDGKGTDVVFETAGSTGTARLTVNIAKRGGTVVHVGWPDPGEFKYNIEVVMEKELDIRGVNRYANAYPQAINLIADERILVGPLITNTFSLDKVDEAFKYTAANKEKVIKCLVK